MTTPFLSTAKTFISSTLLPSTSSSSNNLLSTPPNLKRQLPVSKSTTQESQPTPSSLICTKRNLSVCFLTSIALSFSGKGNPFNANAAILEADDDVELLEKVKKDRQKRIERQGVISSSSKEEGYLQDLVYKLSKVGQAIESNDLPTANSVLQGTKESDWLKKINTAFKKLSTSAEAKTQVDTFNSSLSSLISSVNQNDVESSKSAFVSSASAFEKWTSLAGLVGQLKGL